MKFLCLILLVEVVALSGCHRQSSVSIATALPQADSKIPKDSSPEIVLAELLARIRTDDTVTQCKSIPIPSDNTCTVTPGNSNLLIQGNVLGISTLIGGELLIGENGKIACVQCDCSKEPEAQGATVIACGNGVISPGLINAHDHLGYNQNKPTVLEPDLRFDHRNAWRKDGHPHVAYTSNYDYPVVAWTELRQVIAGTTSVASSAGVPGFLRNLTTKANMEEGLNPPRKVDFTTFPLGDSRDTTVHETGCDYPRIYQPEQLAQVDCFIPHVSEGIDQYAHNEFTCLSGQAPPPGVNLLSPKSSFIHSIALTAADVKLMVDNQMSMVWSPRSNISLYGNTAAITLYNTLGLNIALSTDWTPSGSMNLLRELKCADELNKHYFSQTLTDKELWLMVTANAAVATQTLTGSNMELGFLYPGLYADVVVFNGESAPNYYRAVINSSEKKVALVLRGGTALYGDTNIMSVVAGPTCEIIPGDVCGISKMACILEETSGQYNFSQLQDMNKDYYGLFYCETPVDEPTCQPLRTVPEKNSCGTYPLMGIDDRDHDGVEDTVDNCPDVFNPMRPLDNYIYQKCQQADYDNDSVGDVCDSSPLGN